MSKSKPGPKSNNGVRTHHLAVPDDVWSAIKAQAEQKSISHQDWANILLRDLLDLEIPSGLRRASLKACVRRVGEQVFSNKMYMYGNIPYKGWDAFLSVAERAAENEGGFKSSPTETQNAYQDEIIESYTSVGFARRVQHAQFLVDCLEYFEREENGLWTVCNEALEDQEENDGN